VWNKKYREYTVNNSDWRDTIYCQFTSITETNDGGLAAVARVRSTECPCKDFKIFRMNSNGDTLWTKPFSSYPDGNILYEPNSIIQTQDGGFAVSGSTDYWVWNDSTSEWDTNQGIFLIKTDSLGNDHFVSVSEPQTKPITRYELVVYPNPASDYLFIETDENSQANGELTIVNQSGQIVYQNHTTKDALSSGICVSNFTPGNYLIQLKTENKTFFGKFVKY
jgi:hypothetical protein